MFLICVTGPLRRFHFGEEETRPLGIVRARNRPHPSRLTSGLLELRSAEETISENFPRVRH